MEIVVTRTHVSEAQRRAVARLRLSKRFGLEVLSGADGVIANFLGAQTEVCFIPIYDGMPRYIESLKEFESRGFSVVDFVPVSRAAGDLLMLEMDCVLARRSESTLDCQTSE